MNLIKSLRLLTISGLLIFTSCNETQKKSVSKNDDSKLIAQANVLPTETKVPTIYETISIDVSFTKLHKIIMNTKYPELLHEKGPYTIFTPLNGAVNKLHPKTLKGLQNSENQQKLEAIMDCHIISGVINRQDIIKAIKENGGSVKLKTIGGTRLIASMKGDKIYLIDKKGNAGRLMRNDIEASNGIIHTIESVMMPAN